MGRPPACDCRCAEESSSASSSSSSQLSVTDSLCYAGCAALPLRWELEISGYTNSTCTSCGDYNGTFILKNFSATSNICIWTSDELSACGGSTERFRLTLSSGGDLFLTVFFTDTLSADYIATIQNCLGENTLAFDRATAPCGGSAGVVPVLRPAA